MVLGDHATSTHFPVTFSLIWLWERSHSQFNEQQPPLQPGGKKVCSFKHNSHVHTMFWYFLPTCLACQGKTHIVYSPITNRKWQRIFRHSGQKCKNHWEWVSAWAVPEWSASIMAPARMVLSKVGEVFNEFKRTYLVLNSGRGRHLSFVPLFPHGLVYLSAPWNGCNYCHHIGRLCS